MAIGKPRWELIRPPPELSRQLYSAPHERLSQVRFGTRVLIEGLIGLGTLKPGDVPELLLALERNARVPAFQERLLESLFGEERIRNVKAIVEGQLLPLP